MSKAQNWWENTFPDGLKYLEITDSQGKRVSIAYGEIGQGKPLVLMHGWGVWSYSWAPLIPLLSQQFRVICFDAKGFGYSDKPMQTHAPGYQIIETISILEALGAKQQGFNLLAESLGAVIALGVAQQRPDLVASLIVLDAAIFPRHMPHWSMYAMIYTPLSLVRWLEQWRLIRFFAPLLRWFIRTGAGAIYHQIPADNAERAAQTLLPYVEFPGTATYVFADSKSYLQEIQALLRGKPCLLQQLQSHLPQVSCPCLILWGRADRWFPIEDGERLASLLPNAQLHLAADCGHHIAGDCPTFVAQQVQAFLR